MKISQNEIESVSQLNAFDKYNYFIKKVADFELMYSLVDTDGNIATLEIDDNILLPFWSSSEYALLNAIKEWDNYEVKEISIEYFENEIIDVIESKNYLLSIFPIKEKVGFIVNLNEFAKDLSNEMDKY